MPVLMLMLITVLNDGTLIAIGYNTHTYLYITMNVKIVNNFTFITYSNLYITLLSSSFFLLI